MTIKELEARQGKVELVGTVTEVSEPREFQKFGNTGRVANAKLADETGEITLTLWNDQIDQVKPGAKVKITNGYVGEWQGEKQLSTGKFGTLEVLGQGEAPAKKEVVMTPDELDEEIEGSDDVEEEDFQE